MRTSQQLYNQIRWDARFDPSAYRLGIQTRHRGVQEVAVMDFQPGDAPWHKILYIKDHQGLVWDRASKLDILSPGRAPAEEGDTLVAMTFNCCAGRHGLSLEPRQKRIMEILRQCDADLMALQEVGPQLFAAIEREFTALGYTVVGAAHPSEQVLITRWPLRSASFLELSQGKWAIVGQLPSLTVAAVHLTSDYRGDASSLRRAQWKELQQALGSRPWLALGDFNASGLQWNLAEEQRIVEIGPKGPTFDPRCNPWAARTSQSGKEGCLDRVLMSSSLSVQWAVIQSSIEVSDPASDHYPALVRLQRQRIPALTHLSALSILLPAWLEKLVQPIRAEHDPAFRRWMPHLNLVYPAPAQIDPAALNEVVGQMSAFRLGFKGLATFENGPTCIVYLCPDEDSTSKLRDLQQRLVGALGREKSSQYTPHVTLARFSAAQAGGLPRKWAQDLGTPQFQARSVAWLRRKSDTPFAVETHLSLGPVGNWTPVYNRVASALGERARGRLHVVGSSCWVEGRDLDLVYLASDQHKSDALLDDLAKVWPEARRVGSGLRLQLDGQSVDLALSGNAEAILDQAALLAHVRRHYCEEHFRQELATILQWAEARGVKGQAYGYPGGLAWAVLLAHFGPVNFYAGCAAWNWKQPVSLRGAASENSRPRARMTVLAPALPWRNLTAAVTASTAAVLAEELGRAARGQSPPPRSGSLLRLQCPNQEELVGAMQGKALAIIVDLEKKLKLSPRPFPPGSAANQDWSWTVALPVDVDKSAILQLVGRHLPEGATADFE